MALGTVYIVDFNAVTGAPLLLTVGAYAVLDTLACSSILSISLRRLFDLKLTLAMLAIFLVVVLPTISWMIMRQATTPWQYIHDGAIQIEESIKYLLQGKNPYTEDYLATPLAQWEYIDEEGIEENPALYHNAYLPFIFLFSTPFYVVVKHVTGWYDQRLVYLFLFVCTLWLLMNHATKPTEKLALLIVFGLNLFAASYTIWGGNDVFVMFWLLTGTYLLQRGRITAAALCVGLACASKQTAWLFVPFFLTYVWSKASPPRGLASLRKAYPIFIVPLLLILPFLFWDAASFVDDTYLYLSGQAVSSYPIVGRGFGGLLLDLGLIRDKTAYFPFIFFQAAFCLPLLVFLLRSQLSDNTVRRCWLGYGLLLLTFTFFSRFFSDFYLGAIVNAIALGYLSNDAGPGA
ncbi:MAG: hypothetical protein CEE40_02365 [Chloroflexi bacterium B3_Chlor]|nr:MAG: hypothetical protein CEE40_02365 [Chloroflexi bacterium B3_Chlor]